jgi:cysteinyl-tRNA synthetase, unknown class
MKKIIILISSIFIITVMSDIRRVALTKSNLINYRDEMRKLVILISKRSRSIKKDFMIIPQNALDLITTNGKADVKYLDAIDAAGREELFYGLKKDGIRTPKNTTNYFLTYLSKIKNFGKSVLIIDYVNDLKQAVDSNEKCAMSGFISFQAQRSLSDIPEWIFHSNDRSIKHLKDAKNFLYLLNAGKFRSKEHYLWSISKKPWDILIIDLFFGSERLTREDLERLKVKQSGGKRLVISYLSIGEAEIYRYYWDKSWEKKPPLFLEKENKEWKGNYKVRYWMDEWKEIICGRENGSGFDKSYLRKVIDSGFDGVYLDIIDAAYYFEEKGVM